MKWLKDAPGYYMLEINSETKKMEKIYVKNDIRCEKCGGQTYVIVYHKTGFYCSGKFHHHFDEEHLHYKCKICGFDWCGEVLEKDEK